ncbi:MAG: hypothetical protein AAF004_11050 [Pseudomonadota bacterium]
MKRKTQRDPFAFSLRGMTVVAPAIAPIVVDDRALRKRDCRSDVEEPSRAIAHPIAEPTQNSLVAG